MGKKYKSEILLLTKTKNINDLSDWMDYHINEIGFDHIMVFDNESEANIIGLCESYGDKVTYSKITGWPDQYNLYTRYINEESEAEWVIPIDDDEYIKLDGYNSINVFLDAMVTKLPKMKKLSVREINMFPEDPLAKRGDMKLNEFCTCDNVKWSKLFNGDKIVKTFVNTKYQVDYSVKNKYTHNPYVDGDQSYMCNGARIRFNKYHGKNDVAIRIMHYQYKSKDEWIWKCKNRGRVSRKSTKNRVRKEYNYIIMAKMKNLADNRNGSDCGSDCGFDTK